MRLGLQGPWWDRSERTPGAPGVGEKVSRSRIVP